MPHTYGSFHNRPTLQLYKDEANSDVKFIFGVHKAKLILENLEAIKEFVKAHEKEEDKPE